MKTHARDEILPYELLVRDFPKSTSSYHFLGCRPELDGKTVLLKILHCLGCITQKKQTGMEVETPHVRASVHSPRRCLTDCWGLGRRCQSMVLDSCESVKPAARQEVATCVTVALL